MGVDEQLACSNITCTANSSLPFTKETAAKCLAAGTAAADRLRGSLKYPEYLATLSASESAAGAGANAQLYNGMVRCWSYPFFIPSYTSTSFFSHKVHTVVHEDSH